MNMSNKMHLVTFEIGQERSGINPQAFTASSWEQGKLFFFHEKFLDYSIFQSFQANPCGFMLNITEELLNKCAKSH